MTSNCPGCGTRITQPNDPGRKRRYCSNACRQAAYRARKHRAQQDAARARARAHAGAGTAGGGAGRDWWEEQAAWTWASPPNPGNGTDDPRERARRIVDALRRKADRTTFPHEADACRAKAEELRRKYAL